LFIWFIGFGFDFLYLIGFFLFYLKPGPKWVVIPVVLKAVLSVLFVAFCNFDPASRKNIPVLITNDYVYWAGSAIIPLVSGYLISLLMMYVPKQVEGKNAGTAAMLSALVLVIGVVTGLQFSRFLEMIVLL
jgi:equilibrative nucleoside transporter 1/2/3